MKSNECAAYKQILIQKQNQFQDTTFTWTLGPLIPCSFFEWPVLVNCGLVVADLWTKLVVGVLLTFELQTVAVTFISLAKMAQTMYGVTIYGLQLLQTFV